MANTTGRKFGGRKKGTPNKSMAKIRERVMTLLNNNWAQILVDLGTMSPKDRVDCYLKLLDYALPKLSRIEMREAADDNAEMDLTEEERDQIIRELIAKYYEDQD